MDLEVDYRCFGALKCWPSTSLAQVSGTFISWDSLVLLSDEESMADETSVTVQEAAKETLLQGLVDENQGLQ